MSDLGRSIHLFLTTVRLRDILDILIVALLFYQLLKLFRGTQAIQLLVGVAVLFAVGLAAQQFNLRLIDFIFANSGQYLLIVAVILFQPELRRALDQVGRLGPVRTIIGVHGGVETQRVVDEIVRAATSLSEHRTGALVVFERETGLENVAMSGVRIDGEVTAEMLASLFVPGSPLHDGAVIIRQNRLVAAGCVLPLAETLPGVGRMGTRHRAALGLTLQSDAAILIVSEETGLLSLAHEGKLFRGLDQVQLRERLITLVGTPVTRRRAAAIRPFVRSVGVRVLGRRSQP